MGGGPGSGTSSGRGARRPHNSYELVRVVRVRIIIGNRSGKTRTSAGTSLVGRRVVVRVVPWAIRPARESRGYRLKMRRGLLCLLFATELELIRMLIEDNWLRCLIDTACPWCCIGKLGPLNDVPGRSYVHRCHRKGCQKYVHPHAFRPIFQTTGRGTKHVPLRLQCAIVFALIAPAAVCILA